MIRKVLDQPNLELDLIGDTPGEYAGIDRFGRPVDWNWKSTSGAGDSVARTGHTYSLDSLRLTRTDPVAAAAGKDLDENYVYDRLDQLKEVDRNTRDLEWIYEEIGNWLRFENSETGTQDRSHNDLNQITGITDDPPPNWENPVYDGDGRTTLSPRADDPTKGYHHVYDAWGRIVETWIPHPLYPGEKRRILRHCYDARGYRVRTQVHDPANGKLRYTDDFVHDEQWRPVVVVRRDPIPDSDGELGEPYVQRQFLWTPTTEYPDTLVRQDTRNNPGSSQFQEEEYALQDDHANAIASVDASGSVSRRWTYEPFGQANWLDANFDAAAPAPEAWPVLFSGYRIEENTGLYQVRHRTYDPALGRWLSRDPIGERGGMNLYAFVQNDGVNHVDPLGLYYICSGWIWTPETRWIKARDLPGIYESQLRTFTLVQLIDRTLVSNLFTVVEIFRYEEHSKQRKFTKSCIDLRDCSVSTRERWRSTGTTKRVRATIDLETRLIGTKPISGILV